MGGKETCGPKITEVREIGQTARLFFSSLNDFTKRGGWIWAMRRTLCISPIVFSPD
jgi:hypothetical protein